MSSIQERSPRGKKVLGFLLVYTTAWFIPVVAFFFTGWPGKQKGCVGKDDCFCEHFEVGTFLGQPVNTITNIAYIIMGFVIAWRFTARGNVNDTGNPFGSASNYSILYSILVINIGVGSFYMHAGQVKWAGTFDVFSMNMFIVFVLVYSITRLLDWQWRYFLLLYIPLEVFMFIQNVTRIIKPNTLFGIITAVTTGWEVFLQVWLRVTNRRKIARDWKLLLLSVLFFLVAFGIWELENFRIWPCDPYAIMQPHGLWHILTALATLAIFYYIRSRDTNLKEFDD